MADVEYFGVPPSEVRNVESRYRYLAASGQTEFAANYEIGFVDVYKNGVKLDPVSDFTATDRVKITLSVGATLNDKIQIITRRQIPLANALAKTGDVATGTITLPSPVFTGTPVAPTAAYGTNTTQVSTTAFVQAALQAIYPVGTVYTNAANTANPSTLFGFGTWEEIGAGRVLVGQNTSDTLFDTLGETGGSKDAIVVSHTHTVQSGGEHAHTINDPGHSHTFSAYNTLGQGGNEVNVLDGPHSKGTSNSTTGITINSTGSHTHAMNSVGESGTNANLQPYIVVKMWKRTA